MSMDLPPLLKNNEVSCTQIPGCLSDKTDIDKYQELVNLVFQIFSNGFNLKGKKRTLLWTQFFDNINIFINDVNMENIIFIRCISAGALIFQLETKETFIYLNINILQDLFSKTNIPSQSTILKKIGKISDLPISRVPLLCSFREFLDDIAIQYPKCNVGWNLYEFNNEINSKLMISPLSINECECFDEKIVNCIIDDDDEKFSIIISKLFHDNININQRYTLTKYKMPNILLDNPSYAHLCAFFQAHKCLATMCLYVENGLNSEELHITDNKGRTLLHFAAAGGCKIVLEQLLDAGYNANEKDLDGYNPSHYAALMGNVETIKYLWEKGADVFSSNFPTFLNPFQVASYYGNLNVLEFLYDKANPSQIATCIMDMSENNPLLLACKRENVKSASFLLEKMNLISKESSIFDNIIFKSFVNAYKSGSINCLKLIINSKFMHSISADEKKSFLVNAVKYGHADIVNFILKTFPIKEDQLIRALEIAVTYKYTKIVNLLINNGAAQTLNKSEIGDLFMLAFGNIELVQYLDKMLNIPYEIKGKLFTEKAIRLKDENLVTFLIEKKCEISIDSIKEIQNQNSPFLSFLKKQNINIPFSKLIKKKDHLENVSLDRNFEEILTQQEIKQFEDIQNHFQKIDKLTTNDYYSLIDTLSRFCTENEEQRNIPRCSISGIIPSFYRIKFNQKFGTIYALNETKISQIIGKSSRTFSKSFLKQNAIMLNHDEVEILFAKKKKICSNFFSYCQIMIHLGYDFKFYFIFNPNSEIETFNLNFFEPDKHKKDLPNNIKFIKDWQASQKLEKKDKETKKNIKNWTNFINQIKALIGIISNLDFSENNSPVVKDSSLESFEKFDGKDLSENEIYEYGLSTLNELNDSISQFVLQYKSNENINLEKITEIIYSDDENKKENAKQIINDILFHKKYHSWENSKTLEFSFLIKYCSSSSYLRLYHLLNQKLPSPSSIESRFRKSIIEREKLLTNASDITKLLDQYWSDVKTRVEKYLKEYNEKFGTNIEIDDFKIPICLGCDAASLTKFTEKVDKNKKAGNEKLRIDKKLSKKIKKNAFQKLVMENSDSQNDLTSLDNPQNDINDEDSQYFFTMLIQPFIWKFPCTVIHLTRSSNGHFSHKEANDILELLNLINAHPHFQAKYFAADGERGLDEYHEMAFKQYESYIEKLIKNEITFDSFFDIVKKKVKFLPIIDMFHAEKSGRNHIMNNEIKLGEDSDIVNRSNLNDHLQLHKNVLNDLTSIGRMKDDYPIQLFQIANALNEFKHKNNSSGLYLFVYSLVLELFRNPFMKIEFRFFLSKLALLLLLSLYQKTYKLPTNTALRKNSRSKKEFVFFNDRIGIIKLINTTIALSTILSKNKTSFCLGLERISSYPEEEYFGNYRTHFNGFYTTQNAFRYAVRSSLALDFQSDLNIEFPISKRENFAGAHLNYENSKGENFDKFSIFDEIQRDDQVYEIAIDIYKTGTGEKTKLGSSTYNFIQTLSQFFEIKKSYRSKKLSDTKGSSILPRIKASQKNK